MLSTTNENIPPPGSLPVISQEELNVALEKHLMFLRGQIGGQRLIMQYKDLSNLNFHNRDISQSDFTGSMFCLLYTSPSPRDQRGSRMPSSA